MNRKILKLILKVLINILILVVIALGLTYLLTFRQFLGDAEKTAKFVNERPRVFYYTALIMFAWLIFLTGIVRTTIRAGGITFILIVIVTYINICKFRLRGTPLLPEDFQMVGETGGLLDFVDIAELIRLIVAVILIIGLICILQKIIKKAKLDLFTTQRSTIGRIGMILVGAVMLINVTGFVRHHNGERYEYVEFLDSTFTAWNQTRNYDENGFLIGFLYNLAKLEIREPEDYSEEKILAIKEEYLGNSKEEVEEEKPNIVIILNESFIDPETIREFYQYTGGDVTPELHKIEEKAESGEMFSIDYGGGTANVEFEMLTGLTNYWLNTVPYTNLLSKRGEIESIASEAREAEYKTVAIHPYNGGMYKRNIVLKNMGFEKFITETEMNFKEREGDSEYINDWSSYQEILKELREDGVDERKLIFNITMQNHTPYKESTYENLEFRLADEYEGWRKGEIEAYFQTLHESDRYLGELIAEIDKLDEKTVVLFFGDHSAGVFDELRNSEDLEKVKLTRLTPYFIYANYEVMDESYLKGKKLETVTPNCLTTEMRKVVKGIGFKTELSRLTREVCETTPVLTSLYYNYQDIEMSELLKKYELVTYDLAAGKKFWE